jgi:pimeloyl-ACP methyl ester carboxylesterase
MRPTIIVSSILALAAATHPLTVRSAQAQSNTTQAAAPFTVRVVGKGAPIILIPGLTNNGDVWNETVAELSKTYQCHVFSLAGFAGTPAIMADSTWVPRMRDSIIAYVRTKRLNKPIIIGHSLGGNLALDIAATAPDLPRAIVNVDGMPFLPAASIPGSTVKTVRPMAEQMRRAMATRSQPGSATEAQLRTLVRDTTRLAMLRTMQHTSDAATVAEAMFALYTTDLRPDMARVTAPVLNLHAWIAYKPYGQTRARMDTLLADQYAGLKHQTTRVSDTAYHFIMFDEPAWFMQEVKTFLAANR